MTRTKLISLTLSFIFLTFLPVLHYSFPREDAKEAFVAGKERVVELSSISTSRVSLSQYLEPRPDVQRLAFSLFLA